MKKENVINFGENVFKEGGLTFKYELEIDKDTYYNHPRESFRTRGWIVSRSDLERGLKHMCGELYSQLKEEWEEEWDEHCKGVTERQKERGNYV